jgi:hypothetical protein
LGTREDPYLICSTDHLNGVSLYETALVRLTTDIDVTGVGIRRVNVWRGDFDGAGFRIIGWEDDGPLFETVAGSIHDVTWTRTEVSGNGDRLGAVASELTASGTMERVVVSGSVVSESDIVGGIVGLCEGTILESRFEGNVEGGQIVGGIAGENRGRIGRVQFTGAIRSVFDYAGGIAGVQRSGGIDRAVASGSVSGRNVLGGIVGQLSASVLSNSFSTVNVSGTNFIGGLLGHTSGEVSFTYADSFVTGSGPYIGGLAGFNSATGNVNASYWNLDKITMSAAGIGKHSSELLVQSTFGGWDFLSVWLMPSGAPPLLR